MPALGLTSVFFKEPSVENWAKARDCGFENVEICYRDSLQTQPMIEQGDQVYRNVLAAGMKPATAHLPFLHYWDISSCNKAERRLAIEAQRSLISHISDLHIPLIVLHPSFEPIDPTEREARLVLSAEAIADLGAHARERGVVLAVENLPRTCLGNCAADMLLLTDHGRSASICMDVNHLLLETHESYINQLGPYIVHTHMSDYDRTDEKHWLPGNGVIDWHALISRLTAVGYQGSYLFEIREYTAVPGSIVSPAEVMQRLKTSILPTAKA